MFGNGFNLNFEQDIFNIPWNSSFGPAGGIADPGYGLGRYGFQISGGTLGHLKSTFYSRNWFGGEVDVEYPVDIHLTYPAPNSFERGEQITINSSYTLNNTANIETRFPQAGNVGLEFSFNFRFWLWPTLCFYSCVTPGFDTGNLTKTLTLFDVSQNEVKYACPDLANNFLCSSPLLPFNMPANDYGFDGQFDLPYVTTTSSILPNKCLTANGRDNYAWVGVDVFDFIGGMNIPYVSPVLANLDNSECFLGNQVCLDYTLFSATFGVYNDNVQEFEFCPEVYTSIGFPTPVVYTITDPNAGNAIVEGPLQKDTIRFLVGNDLNINYPCNYEFMNTSTEYDIENDFSNKTEDEIRFNLTLEAMSVNLQIQGFSTPGVRIDPPCIFYYLSCSGWSCGWRCGYDPPAFWLPPPISLGPWNFGVGPLYQQTLPLGSLPGIPWYDNTWELDGFTKKPGSGYQLIPRVFKAELLAKSDVTCFDLSDGMMQVQLTNGTSPFQYQWSDGSINNSALNTDINNQLTAGNQYVLIEDANGCEVIADTIILQPLDSLHLQVSSITNVDCFGNNSGNIATTFTGGNTIYNYNWTPNISSGAIANNLVAGSYQLNVVDDKGCNTTQNFNITEPTGINIVINTDSVNCKGEASGSASSLVSGGTPPYNYSWSNGSNTANAQNLSVGAYQLNIVDLNGCTASANFNIYEPNDTIAITATSNNISCFEGSDGSISVNVTGGTGNYNYSWFNNNNQVLSPTSPTIQDLPKSTYTVQVTDERACRSELQITLTEPQQLLTSISGSNISCYNGNDGLVNLSINGGTTPYIVNWNNGSTQTNLTNLNANTYIATITDNNNCSVQDSIILTQPTQLTQSFIKTNVNCFGDNTGSIDYSLAGGTTPYSYNWSNGSNNEDIENLTSNTYSITATDANGCSISESINIEEPIAPLSITETTTNVNCFGGSNGSISTTVSGGTTPYSYVWNNQNHVVLSDTSDNLENITAQDYQVKVTDTNGCILNHTISITEPTAPLAINFSSTDILCHGQNTGSISSQVEGGTQPYTYLWSNNNQTPSISNLAIGTYTLLITDNNGCILSDSISLTQPETAISAVFNTRKVSCLGGNDGYAQVIASGGIPGYNYTWDNGSNTNFIDNVTAGTYSVTITDANNCIYSNSISVIEPTTSISISNIDISNVLCKGGNDGEIIVEAINGTTPYVVHFGDSTYNLFNNQNNYTLSNLSTGNYHLNIIDYKGCEVDTLLFINEPDTLSAQFDNTDVLCYKENNGAINLSVLGGTPNYQYFWSNGQTTEDLNNLFANEYTVIIKDANNCQITASTIVNQPNDIQNIASITNATCKDNNDGIIEVNSIGGTPEYYYSWSNNETDKLIENLTVGEYTLTVTDANGCVVREVLNVSYDTENCINPPTVFTPDGDGINDTWIIEDLDLYPNAVVQIFNKWGKLLYETNGQYIPWNGFYNENVLPSASYYYIINLNNESSNNYTGSITILRSR